MIYGKKPKLVTTINIKSNEMFFYQYLPIKLKGNTDIKNEDRLSQFNNLIGVACCDFIADYGLDRFVNSYVYLTAKHLFVKENKNFNREGWHSDGFMTDDINYIWSDKFPTDFVFGEFNIIQDDTKSLIEFDLIGNNHENVNYPENALLRLDQFVIHKCADIYSSGLRQFVKISFSKDKYDLIGNSHNYLFDYNWEMRERKKDRNIPQKI